jgi:hypothetical protein
VLCCLSTLRPHVCSVALSPCARMCALLPLPLLLQLQHTNCIQGGFDGASPGATATGCGKLSSCAQVQWNWAVLLVA